MFPTETDQDQFACQEYEQKIASSPAIYKLVCTLTNPVFLFMVLMFVDCHRGSQLRGGLKHVVRLLVTSHYHFQYSSLDGDKLKTVNLINLLKTKNSLVYQVCSSSYGSYVLKFLPGP